MRPRANETIMSTKRRTRHRGQDISPINIDYSSYEDCDVQEKRDVRKRPPRDDPRVLKAEALDFNGNLNPETYIWVQSIERIFEVKGYNNGKCFKLAILKMKGYISL